MATNSEFVLAGLKAYEKFEAPKLKAPRSAKPLTRLRYAARRNWKRLTLSAVLPLTALHGLLGLVPLGTYHLDHKIQVLGRMVPGRFIKSHRKKGELRTMHVLTHEAAHGQFFANSDFDWVKASKRQKESVIFAAEGHAVATTDLALLRKDPQTEKYKYPELAERYLKDRSSFPDSYKKGAEWINNVRRLYGDAAIRAVVMTENLPTKKEQKDPEAWGKRIGLTSFQIGQPTTTTKLTRAA